MFPKLTWPISPKALDVEKRNLPYMVTEIYFNLLGSAYLF